MPILDEGDCVTGVGFGYGLSVMPRYVRTHRRSQWICGHSLRNNVLSDSSVLTGVINAKEFEKASHIRRGLVYGEEKTRLVSGKPLYCQEVC